MNVTLMLLGILAVTIGGAWLLDGVSRLARSYNISQLVVGLTVMTLVTATPELLVGINAAREGAGGVVLGTVAGANIVNIGLVLGLGGLIARGLPIATGLVRRGIPTLLIVTLVIYGLMWADALNRVVGGALVAAYVVFMVGIVWLLRRDAAVKRLATAEMRRIAPLDTQETLLVDDNKLLQTRANRVNRPLELVRMLVGVVLLLLGSDYLVQGALEMAGQLDVNAVAVGATVLALATSLPEFVAVLLATTRKQPDVALGNIIGSSVANLLLVLGVAALVAPLTVDRRALWYEFPVMFALIAMLLPVVIDRRLAMWESAAYVGAYGLFIYGIFVL